MSTIQPILATTKPAPRWDLDSVFSGGSRSKEFRDFLDRIHNDLTKLNEEARSLPGKINDLTIKEVADFILEFQRVALHLGLARSFAHCLMSQDVKDQLAFALVSEADTLHASWLNVKTHLESWSLAQSDEAWERLMTLPDIAPIRFYLDELRELAREKMPPEQEALALELAVNGYHAWSRLYDKISGEISVDFEENGKVSKLSIGQLANKFQRPDRDTRRRAFELFEQVWGKQASLCAAALNAQAGFRLTVYKRRGWKTAVHEPLRMNRIQEGTLEAMWSAVTESLPLIEKYVSAKKKLLGIDSFCWYDQFAPVGKLDLHFGFDEAVDFIVRQLATFSEEMAQFTRMAVEKRWIEAEDRPGKADGAFCTGFNLKRESRILMTYSGDVDAMITLAHELGHAYHQWVLRDTPYLVSEYPMGLAETASIFNELKVTGAALREAKDREGRLLLLDQTLQQPLVLFCNIRARYLFDRWSMRSGQRDRSAKNGSTS